MDAGLIVGFILTAMFIRWLWLEMTIAESSEVLNDD
jgi:hypothetical protein